METRTKKRPQQRAVPPSAPAAVTRLNLGCGTNKLPDFLNVDKYAACEPDLVLDLERFPWPWKNDSVSEVVLNHVLEHIGHDPAVFLSFMKELYRVCRGGAEIHIAVPHPRHDDFINDPTHVRPVTPDLLKLFSKRLNRQIKEMGAANSPLALYTNTDFEMSDIVMNLSPDWQKRFDAGEVTSEQILQLARERLNVGREFRMKLKVIKDTEA